MHIIKGNGLHSLEKESFKSLPLEVHSWLKSHITKQFEGAFEWGYKLYFLASLGRRPTKGYGVDLSYEERENDCIKVFVSYKRPSKGQRVARVITYPFALMILERICAKIEISPRA